MGYVLKTGGGSPETGTGRFRPEIERLRTNYAAFAEGITLLDLAEGKQFLVALNRGILPLNRCTQTQCPSESTTH